MNDTRDDRQAVYEIGYLITNSVAEEHVPAEADKVRAIITKAGATVIAEEAPHLQQLAYTMRRKTLSGAYEKYDEAYFGWIKFELSTSAIEGVKKSIEALPSILRMLTITTVRENTYLGKRAPAFAPAATTSRRSEGVVATEEEKKEVAPAATVEEMDKSIDEMVKEA